MTLQYLTLFGSLAGAVMDLLSLMRALTFLMTHLNAGISVMYIYSYHGQQERRPSSTRKTHTAHRAIYPPIIIIRIGLFSVVMCLVI